MAREVPGTDDRIPSCAKAKARQRERRDSMKSARKETVAGQFALMTRILCAALMILALGLCLNAVPAEQAHAASASTTTVKINGKSFKMKLRSGKPAQAFRAYLSKNRSLKMSELNGNEKYHYFSNKTFPTAEKRYKKVKAGDVMLYGDDCLVLFYKTHKTSYSYTKIGRLTSTKGLSKAVGKKSVKVRFSKMKQN